MEFAVAMIMFFGLVISWFVLPATSPAASSTTVSSGDALASAA